MFRVRFVIVAGVKTSEVRSQAAKGADESQIGQTILGHQTEAGFPDEIEALLHLRLDLRKRVARDQIIDDQRMPAISRECEVPRSISDIECAPDRCATLSGVPGPRRQRAE